MLGRAVAVAATLWALLIALATSAAAASHASALTDGFAWTVYRFGGVICHQLPDRTFWWRGVPMPVCARCAGIYAGAALMAMVVTAAPGGRLWTARKVEPKIVLLAALVPSALTLVFEWTTGIVPGNWIRAAAGAPLGAAVAWVVIH